ncbi:MAG: hypothetical protein ABIQ35_15030 [Verrucomicrobiota bacterium]
MALKTAIPFKESLGRLGILLLPSLKMKSRSSRGKTYELEVHEFLVANFSGYTLASGNIAGFWKDSKGEQQYGEHLEYRVGFLSEEKIPMLDAYISELAEELEEESIFWATREDVWLVYRKGWKRP